MRRSSEVHRVNGLIVGSGRIASACPPWPLLVMDVEEWLRLLPALHEMNEEAAALEGDRELELQEHARGAAALRCLEHGRLPTKHEHPLLAMRCLLSPLVVTRATLEAYGMRLCELYRGPAAEPYFILDCRDSVLHLVPELEFLGDLVGPGMLSTTASAHWLSEYSLHLIDRHAHARIQ